ncbi:hypothetical protein Lser_V15G03603 [Lactuca serriola]
MAEIAVTAVITVLCEKLISGDLMKLARSEEIDSQLNKWKKTLPLIQAVLADATQKHIKDRAVQLWVSDLQDLAYDIEDVLDDLATKTLRRKLNQEAHANTSTSSKVLKLFPNCCTNFTSRNLLYGRKMSSKLDEITAKLHDLVDQKNDLGLNVNIERSNIREKPLEQTSLVDESKIMGRKGDKKALMGKLLGNEGCDQNVSIVSIVGMGGIGKTTLAKLIYNEKKVKDHFELMAWVCVSEEYDVLNISKSIFEAVAKENTSFSNLNLLHVALKEKLSKKRFLLILDDVWNEDHSNWELLQSPLLVGAPGSKIIVTTRSTKVALVMDSEVSYGLDVLSNEDGLSLFAQHALGEKNFDKHPTLKLLGEGMVQKCGRLPLALKALGRVLKGNKNGDEWEKLLNSEIWDIDDGSEILPALRLSYYHLPPHLKQLFAYCSLIPKDYVFDKNALVLMWMGEGFLSQSKSMESLGNRLDEEMDISDTNEIFERFRHFSLTGPPLGSYTYRKFRELQRATRLRTFLTFSRHWLDRVHLELLNKLQFLRVLRLTGPIIGVPESIGSLKHLRYLSFSNTLITCLPEEVSDLCNLQTLLLHDCQQLYSLPKSFAKLINLRHLDVSDTPFLKKMPSGIAGLTCLQTLTKVIIDDDYMFKISDLKGLSDLQGRLSIMGLGKVINPMQAKDANLHQKKGLDVLEMDWGNEFNDSRNEMIEYEVLQELRPHPKLKILKILFYKGTRFPTWVGNPSFDVLTELTLCGSRSTHIPTLGHLQSLKKLVVERMNEVKTVGFEFLAPTNSFLGIAFPSLEVLTFKDMKGWQRWSIDSGNNGGTRRSFPRLHEICISNCPELAQVSIGLIPSLRVLYIEECSQDVLKGMVGVSLSLVILKMLDVKGLTHLHVEDLITFGAVEELIFERCDDLRYLWERESDACNSLVSLQKLEVRICNKLVLSDKKEVDFGISIGSLKEVTFSGCETLESYSCPNSVERLHITGCRSLTSLTFSAVLEHSSPCLTFLEISGCQNLKSFPHEHFQSLTSLEEMRIYKCPSMDYSFPCGVWPPNLSSLTIGCLNKPMSEWGSQSFPISLVDVGLFGKNSGVVSFGVADDVRNTTTTTTTTTPSSSSSFLLPPSLVSLTLDGFTDVESFSEVLQHLPCLKKLDTWCCTKITDLKTTFSPSNLTIVVW